MGHHIQASKHACACGHDSLRACMCLCTCMTRGDGVGHQAENMRGRGRNGEMGSGKRMVGRCVGCAVDEGVGWVREGEVLSPSRGWAGG